VNQLGRENITCKERKERMRRVVKARERAKVCKLPHSKKNGEETDGKDSTTTSRLSTSSANAFKRGFRKGGHKRVFYQEENQGAGGGEGGGRHEGQIR